MGYPLRRGISCFPCLALVVAVIVAVALASAVMLVVASAVLMVASVVTIPRILIPMSVPSPGFWYWWWRFLTITNLDL